VVHILPRIMLHRKLAVVWVASLSLSLCRHILGWYLKLDPE